jgi:hypothetical protein
MSFIGNQKVSRQYSEFFSGDSTSVAFTLSYPGMNLNGVSTVSIKISGVTQPTTAYGITNRTLTFASAPPTGTQNIEVTHLLPVSQVATDISYIQTLSTLNVLNYVTTSNLTVTGETVTANVVANNILVKTLTSNMTLPSSNYATLAAAVSVASPNGNTILICSNTSVSANTTVPANVALVFVGNGKLTIETGLFVTINSSITADLNKIFDGGGRTNIIFGPGKNAMLYPQWWGALGNNSTDDTLPLQYAITVANNHKYPLYWPAGTYLTTLSLPDLHTVVHRGPGIIRRSSNYFSVEANTSATIQYLYVDTTGADTNDGLTAAAPFITIQKAFDTLEHYAPLKGQWTVWLANGTYTEASVLADGIAYQDLYLQIRGPALSTVQSVPGVVIDFDGSSLWGMNLGSHNKCMVRDIKFTNWQGVAVTGLNADHHSVLWTYNVHTNLCRQGIVVNHSSFLYCQGGILSGTESWTTGAFPAGAGSVGVVVYAGSQCSLGYGASSLATGTILQTFAQAAYEGKTSTHCVATYCTFKSNEKATQLYSNSRYDERYCDYQKNALVHWMTTGQLTTDVDSYPSEYHWSTPYDQSPANTANNGNFEMQRLLNYSSETSLYHLDAIGGLDICHSRVTTNQTGTIASTLTRTLANVRAGVLNIETGTKGKYLDIWLCGSTTGSGGTKTVQLNLGSTIMSTLTIASGSVTWTGHITIWPSSATQQIVITEATNATITTIRATPLANSKIDNDLAIYQTIPGSGDTAALHECRVTGWGM